MRLLSQLPKVERNLTRKLLSGIAGTIMAITCCAAFGKLGSARISCSSLSNSIDQTLIELMTMASDLVSLEKLHSLATEAGFEEDFLSHFGSRVLPSKNSDDIEFWVGLVHRKLSVALERESVTKGRHDLSDKVFPVPGQVTPRPL